MFSIILFTFGVVGCRSLPHKGAEFNPHPGEPKGWKCALNSARESTTSLSRDCLVFYGASAIFSVLRAKIKNILKH
jgi:hypothetical protein